MNDIQTISRRRLLNVALASSAVTVYPIPLLAASSPAPGLPPIEDFFRPTQVSAMALSGDGKSLLALRYRQGRRNLVTIDVATLKATFITNFSDGDVTGPRWISNDRILFSVSDLRQGEGNQVGGGLFAIDKSGGDYVQLADRSFVADGDGKKLMPASTFFFHRGVGLGKDEILVGVYSSRGTRTRGGYSLHKLNTRSGRSTLFTLGAPGEVVQWKIDNKGVPRVATTRAENVFAIHIRDSEGGPWRKLAEWDWQSPAISVEGFDADGNLYVIANGHGSDVAGLYVMDAKTGALLKEPVLQIKGYDLEPEAMVLGDDEEILGIRYHAAQRGVLWMSDAHQKTQKELEAALPDRIVNFRGDLKKPDQPLLVTTTADVESAVYFLFNQKTRQLMRIGASHPWLQAEKMAATEVFSYPARDGLNIPATLTVPKDAKRSKLPVIVLHYGGPWVRPIEWRFDPLIQFLCSRGYAVFMPAPRASTGYGQKHYRMGWKQWGLAMQDDVTDGVNWLISQGIADKDRIALVGASYGGYLTMMGLVKDPEVYRCGINWVGVTDPAFMFVNWTDFAGTDSSRLSLPALLGDPEKDAEQFRRTSPIQRVAEIQRPVLMGYGGSDRRVPIINGERMRDALLKNGKDVEYVAYPDEGHNWIRQESRVDFWSRAEKFLSKNMAPKT